MKIVLAAAVLLGLLGPNVAAAQEGADEPSDTTREEGGQRDQNGGKAASRFGARAFVRGEYTSNPFHVQNRRLDQFETDDAPGQRFYRMHGPWDFVTHVGLEGRYRLRLGKRRRFGTRLGAGYSFHARSPIADYLSLWLQLRYDLGKRDDLEAEVEVIPRRFKQNYREDGSGGNLPFVPAYYTEVYPRLTFGHDWSKSWSTDFVYRLRYRSFEESQVNHSEARHELWLLFRHRFSKEVDFTWGGALGIALTPDEMEGGVFSVDRSYQVARAMAGLGVRPSESFETGLEVGYRYKRFTTDEALDTARFERTDGRVELGAHAEHELGGGFDLEAGVSWLSNSTSRSDPALDADAFDYEELILTVGLKLTL